MTDLNLIFDLIIHLKAYNDDGATVRAIATNGHQGHWLNC